MITPTATADPSAIDRESITRLVYGFYDEVRADALLGPTFDAVLAGRWAAHLPRMVEFWSTLVLSTRSFSGNVFAKHMALADITPQHFERWLALWFATTDRLFAASIAGQLQTMALGIARNIHRGYFNDDADFARITGGLRHAGH
ncbi:MAG: group III truncated hemoglobin [Rubrivivax sp.]